MSAPPSRVTPGNDPFLGGALGRANGPTNVNSGGFTSPAFSSSPPTALGAGVKALARNDRGSNVTVPYARLVPLHTLGTPQLVTPITGPKSPKEGEGLNHGELAWIFSAKENGGRVPMKSGAGTNRMQRLASQIFMEHYVASQNSKVESFVELGAQINPYFISAFLVGTNADVAATIGSDEEKNIVKDHAAFGDLFEKLQKNAVISWTPDGIVMSRLESPADEGYHSAELDMSSGALFNLAVQGPATTKTWGGNAFDKPLPCDKVFIALVADVCAYDGAEPPVVGYWKKAVMEIADAYASGDPEKLEKAQSAKNGLFPNDAPPVKAVGNDTKGVVGNYRLERYTTAYMMKYCSASGDKNARCGLKRRAAGDTLLTEYIVGGWCIGTVLDSAAQPTLRVGRHRVGSTPMSINVCIEWLNGDQMYRRFGRA